MDVIGLFGGDSNLDNYIQLKEKLKDSGDMKDLYKSKCKVIISTPTQFLDILNRKENPLA